MTTTTTGPDNLTTPPEEPRDPWMLVIGVVLCVIVIALLPTACGATCGLFVRGYDIGAGR